jgi:hypothetical protein
VGNWGEASAFAEVQDRLWKGGVGNRRPANTKEGNVWKERRRGGSYIAAAFAKTLDKAVD